MTIAASVGHRQVLHEPSADDQQQREHHGAGEPGDLALGADVFGDRGARAARRDREALEQPRGDVGDAEDRELLVLVDLLAQPARVAARQDARVGERDERDPDRGRNQPLEVVERARRAGRTRAAPPARRRPRRLRRRARTAATTAVAPTTAMNTPGIFGATRRKPKITSSDADADRECRPVRLVEPREEPAEAREEVLGVDREAEQVGQLRHDHRHRDAHQVAEPDRQRQQLGYEAEPRQPAGEHDRADHERQQPRQREPLAPVARRERDDRSGDERCNRQSGPSTRIRDGPSRK